ncbi:hypothetical protein IA539_03375 [Gordonia sp. zg691]|uniref:Uncharacterized protein n=1 Tax=Gordonia jinghuaiqii TaxID=2758710 RepID=A0A7D7R101_9ACTN|nr:hypothetical protein [Gordonia jinghuaiqii]MBD0860249.1 hypothetical protein [Gordonia jinghuaiqii]MCR5977415.1 hypothetical protein [Gordonia jinghuaiqii]QMT00012.1 hypothetical protein H1R19_13725 [Gordonia jinghuaiqii]
MTHTPPPAAPPAASGPQVLAPNGTGYVTVRTKSGLTKCMVDAAAVICESGAATGWPTDRTGQRFTSFRVSADGQTTWAQGNLGDAPTVLMDYATYSAAGWTIVAGFDGTTFTNDRTGRGVFVSLQAVRTF